MKIILISGTHPRHLYVHQAIIDSGVECIAVVMERENLIPEPPKNLNQIDKRNFIKHFEERFVIENQIYGNISYKEVFKNIKILKRTPKNINSDETVNFIKGFGGDIAFIFGSDLIKDPVLSLLPSHKINLHLGISPWYKGSATLFWPFYFLQPQFAGATFHKIVFKADAGDILHQSVPKLEIGDGIHEVSAKTVIQAKLDLKNLIKKYNSNGWIYSKQKSSGRLFLNKDFQARHLRVIYNLFNNNIVDYYLRGELGDEKPNLINGLI